MSRLKNTTFLTNFSAYVATKNGISRPAARKAITMVFKALRDAIIEFGTVNISGVGTIRLKKSDRAYFPNPKNPTEVWYRPYAVRIHTKIHRSLRLAVADKYKTLCDLFDGEDEDE